MLNISIIQKVLLDGTSLEGGKELDRKAGDGHSTWTHYLRGMLWAGDL